ncbi:MAG: hypothetical protein ACK4WM_06475 [Thermoflexales bacterium]
MASHLTPPDEEEWPLPPSSSGRWEDESSSSIATTWGGRLAWLESLWNDPRSRPLLLISGLAAVGIVGLLCFILLLVLLTERREAVVSLPEPAPLPTLATQPTGAATSPTGDASSLLVVQLNNTPALSLTPQRLVIQTHTYDLQPLLDAGAPPRSPPKETAFWLPSLPTNLLIGLPNNNDNRAVLNGLTTNALVIVEVNGGPQRYRVARKATLSAAEAEALISAPEGPQLVLFLLGERGEQRLVVLARYADELTPNQPASLNAPINLGDVLVTALDYRVLPGGSVGLPETRSYVQVNFQIVSLLSETQVLDAAQFFSELRDASGTAYALSREASRALGGLGFTQGAFQAGDVLTATAGFEVPTDAPVPWEWRFSVRRDVPYLAQVIIPYAGTAPAEPTPSPTPLPTAEVLILNASISPEGNELRVVGTVRNLTGTFLNTSLSDIALTDANGQPAAVNSTLPPLPWTLTPGETLAFQLTFARPQLGPAIFTLYDQRYEIGGF